jgi:hypothetical protein
MEVLRRLRLPDAKSVIPKFGSSANHHESSRKERELPLPDASSSTSPAHTGDKEAVGSAGGDEKNAESARLVQRRARGKQPIAPKPDENTAVIPVGGGPRPKPSKATSTPGPTKANLSPNSTRSRRPKGRNNQKHLGQVRVGRGGAAAQDPPGNVQRNQSIVASHSPGSSAPLSPPSATDLSQTRKGDDASSANRNGKGSKGAVVTLQGVVQELPDVAKPGVGTSSTISEPSQPPHTPTLPLGTRSAGRGPLGMERRPTPAPYVMQSPSGADAKKSAAAMSSLLDSGDGVIGELDGAAGDDADTAVKDNSEEKRLMNQETPRTRNGATVVANDALSGAAEPLVYPGQNSSTSLDASQSAVMNNSSGRMDDEEASLPDAPRSLEAALPKQQANNPNDSTTSLGRQSTTSAAVRRRGRSHSRTRQRSNDPVPATVSVSDGAGSGACPGSPSRTLTRSRSQRRQRRSRSRSNSRTRSTSADAMTASPKKDSSTTSPGTTAGDAARLSPTGGGRRAHRAPPVTKRTHAQKMSMKNAIKAADLDILAPASSSKVVSMAAPLVTSSDGSTASARPTIAAPASSPAAAVTALTETARWKAPENDGASVRPARVPPAPRFPAAVAQSSGEEEHARPPPGDHVAADGSTSSSPSGGETGSGDSAPPKKSNPVRALTSGLLKRRPSFGGAVVAGVLRGGTAAKGAATNSSPVAGPEGE